MRTLTCILFFLAFIATSCDDDERMSTELIYNPATASGENTENAARPSIEFDNEVFEFGTIVAGKKITHQFKFTNTGNAPLLIAGVHSPCGCTVAKNWPKNAIEPGEGGVIEVIFDSTDRQGKQNKQIDIVTNSRPAATYISLRGIVIGPDYNQEELK